MTHCFDWCEVKLPLQWMGSGQMAKREPSVRNREHDAVVMEVDGNRFPNQPTAHRPCQPQLPSCPSAAPPARAGAGGTPAGGPSSWLNWGLQPHPRMTEVAVLGWVALNWGSTPMELNDHFTHFLEAPRIWYMIPGAPTFRNFFTFGGLVCWYLATNSRQQDSFKFKIYFTVFLAFHLVQDMHSNGNALLSVVRLHRSLLPRFSYILD